MKTKKLLSLLLALMMMLSVVPMYASAAEPIALTEANVTVWPTASGEIYFGQKISDGITLSGGEVQYDGAVVAGHFEIVDPDFRPTSSSSSFRLDIKFIPDDTSSYVGFEITRCKNVTCAVNKTTPVFVNENDTIPVATEVEPGAKLSTSTLSGALVMNPYYPEEAKALAGIWKWTTGTTIVNESGYYEARITISNYERLYAQVYVKVKENTLNTTIIEAPSVGELTYDANKTWADVTLTGGKAVEEGTETEVTGTFAITKVGNSSNLNKVINNGDTIEITFTPTDTDKYLTSKTTVIVTVNPAPIKFVDADGNEVVPEITVEYGTNFNDIRQLLMPYVKGAEYTLISLGDLENTKCTESGTYTITASAPSDGAHYEKTELSFKLVVEPKTLAPKAYSSTEGYYVEDTSGTYRPEGTFDVYIDGELYKSGVKYLEKVVYEPETSGTHEIKFVYKPVENDNFAIENEITVTVTVNLVHKLTLSDNILGKAGDYRYGTTHDLSANIATENFAGWKITDASGKEVDLGIDLTQRNITITMPDYDIHVEALEKNATGGDDSTGGIFDGLGDLTQGDSDNPIVNIFNNIIAWFRNLIETIKNFFRGIGNVS